MKNKPKKSKINFDDIIKNIPLRTRIRVINEMELIDALTELGFREDRSWGDDEQELLNKIIEHSSKHTDYIMKEIKQWEKDGRPE